MKSSELFELTETSPQKSKLRLSGAEKTINIPGSVLEAQMELENGWYLILTTENSPYDEALHITLLDQRLEILDQVEISQDMTPGIVKDIQIVDAVNMQFNFNRINPYVLEVDRNGFMLPAQSEFAKRDFIKKLGRKYIRVN